MPLGEGEVPVREIIGLLAAGGYAGYLSVEWEKYWHPDIEEARDRAAPAPEGARGMGTGPCSRGRHLMALDLEFTAAGMWQMNFRMRLLQSLEP